jgi:hypothetical protein
VQAGAEVIALQVVPLEGEMRIGVRSVDEHLDAERARERDQLLPA